MFLFYIECWKMQENNYIFLNSYVSLSKVKGVFFSAEWNFIN